MIYSYEYLNSKISKGQSFVNYVILEVLCRAHVPGMPLLFDEHAVIPKYQGLVNVNEKYIKAPLNRAYQICKGLNGKQRKIIKRGLYNNLNVEGICNGTVKPLLFKELKTIDNDLANQLYIFNTYLYKEVIKLAPFTNFYGSLMEHYNAFAISNGFKTKRCPFCGSTRMLNQFNTKREAYDHFLPKEQYPFISIHFMNLAPMCYICNSSYKSRKNPIDINGTGVTKKVFFPFFNYGKINFEVNLANLNLEIITPDEISINNSLVNHDEEIESWEEIFGIDERYKGVYAGDGFSWVEEVRIATNNFGETYSDYKSNLDLNYFANESFMKLALLEACERINLISA
jgi:hypothetical protein